MQEYKVWSKEDREFLKEGEWLETSLDKSSISKTADTIKLGEYEDLVFIQLTGAIDSEGKPISDGDIVIYNGDIYVVEMINFEWVLSSGNKTISFRDIAWKNIIKCKIVGNEKYAINTAIF